MQIAVLLYEGVTALDAVGPYEVLSRLPGAETVFMAERIGPVRCDTGALALIADATLAEVPHPDIIVVPGGRGQARQMHNGAIHRWLRRADLTSQWTTSVCTGSLILAAAGLLNGRRAASHWLALEMLAPLGATPAHDRICFDGKYATAAGVSAGLDMALALAAEITGPIDAQAIQLGLQYAPQPPFDAGEPGNAPPPIVDALISKSSTILGINNTDHTDNRPALTKGHSK